MHLALRNQITQVSTWLPTYKALPLSYTDLSTMREKITTRHIQTPRPVTNLLACNLTFFFAYSVFPPHILQGYSEWHQGNREMRIGDIIIQQVALPPFPLSIKCLFAVRILEICRAPEKVGFRYGTLQGHVEQGVSEFFFALQATTLSVNIHTFSQPGHLISRMAGPFFTRPYQQYCTNQALVYLEKQFLEANRVVDSVKGN